MRFDTLWLDARLATLSPDAAGLGDRRARRGRGRGRAASPSPGPMADLPAGWDAARPRRARRPLDHARPDRLPHPSRLCRQPRARVRAAAGRRHLRGDRAGRRRHRLDREGDARGERGRSRARERCRGSIALLAEGVTTVEIKSGYGLDLETETQDAARRAPARRASAPSTWSPPFSARTRCRRKPTATRTRYIAEVCAMLPAHRRRRAWPTRSTRSARASPSRPSRPRACSRPRRRAGLPVKLHADQLSNLQRRAARRRATARCRPIISNTPTRPASPRWRSAGTVAVLLPGAFYFLRETQQPPIDAAPPARRADGDRDRLQSRHLAADLAAADA